MNRGSAMRRACWLVVLLSAALFVGAAAAAARTEGADAGLCKADWAQWKRIDGTSFANLGGCQSYVQHGGTPARFSASTSSHATATRVDLPTIQLILGTRVLSTYQTLTVFDQTSAFGPQSAEVSTMMSSAHDAIVTEFHARPESHVDHLQVSVGAPVLSTSESSNTVLVGSTTDRTEVIVLTTITFEPDGTARINTNTHTEQFVSDNYQTTVTTSFTWQTPGYLSY